MSVADFYLHALTKDRRKRFEFLLSVNHYVQDIIYKTDSSTDSFRSERLKAAFRTRCNMFIICIGETVLEFMKECMSDSILPEVTSSIVTSLGNELHNGIAVARSDLLTLACKTMIEDNLGNFSLGYNYSKFYPFTDECSGVIEAARSYLLHSFQKYTRNLPVPQYDAKLKRSLFSNSMIYIRFYLEHCGNALQNNPGSYFRFYACMCTLLLHVTVLGYDDFGFQIIGEAERVLQKRSYTYPGLASLYSCAELYVHKLQFS